MDTNTYQPQSIREIFANSFKLFERTWLHLSPLTVFLMLIIIWPSLFIYNTEKPLAFIGYFIFSIFVFSSAVYYTAHKHKNDPVSLKKSILMAAEKLPKVLIATILVMTLTLLGYGFLILPGIIVTVWLSMSLPLILIDNTGPLSVIRKSYELTTDNWARTAIVVLFPPLLTGLIGFGVTEFFIFYKLDILYYKWILGFFIFFTSLFYLPWIAALLILQFEDLKKRKTILASTSVPVENKVEL